MSIDSEVSSKEFRVDIPPVSRSSRDDRKSGSTSMARPSPRSVSSRSLPQISGILKDKYKDNYDDVVRSVNAIMEHSEEQENGWMLAPNARIRKGWDLIMIVGVMYALTVIPFRFAFDVANSKIDYVDVMIADVVFIFDIFVNFISYQEKPSGEVIVSSRDSMFYYIRTWFPIDLLSALPRTLINSIDMGNTEADGVFMPLRILSFTRLLKATKAFRLSHLFRHAEFTTRIHPAVSRMVALLLTVFIVGHISACLWYFIGEAYMGNPHSWIHRIWSDESIIDKSAFERYIVSVYFIFTVLATVGFGDISPRTRPEIVFCLLLFVIGAAMYSYTMANIVSLLNVFDRDSAVFREKMGRLLLFCQQSNLKKSTTKKVLAQMSREWAQPSLAADWDTVREDLPTGVRYLIMKDGNASIIESSKIFQIFHQHPIFLEKLVASLRPFHAAKGQIIASGGNATQGLYVVVSGSVDELCIGENHDRVFVYGQGASFGEIGLFVAQSLAWEATYRCAMNSTLLYISRADLFTSLTDHEECLEIFQQRAKQKKSKFDFRKMMMVTHKTETVAIQGIPASEQQHKRSHHNRSWWLTAQNQISKTLKRSPKKKASINENKAHESHTTDSLVSQPESILQEAPRPASVPILQVSAHAGVSNSDESLPEVVNAVRELRSQIEHIESLLATEVPSATALAQESPLTRRKPQRADSL